MRWLVVPILVAGCTTEQPAGPEFDGATGAEPISSLSAAIRWNPTDDDASRYAIFASETPGGQDFANPNTVTKPGALRGPLTDLSAGVDYYVVVRAMDENDNQDDNTVEVVARAGEPASLAGAVQPIYDQRCAYGGCHFVDLPAEFLDLSAGNSHAATVGVEAVQCTPARLLVAAGDPASSYLIDKIIAEDMCSGIPMPRTGNVNSVDIQIISDWIAEGALDN